MADGKTIVLAAGFVLAVAAVGAGGTAISAVQNGRAARSPSADATSAHLKLLPHTAIITSEYCHAKQCFLSALLAAGKKFKCDDLVLITDRVNETVKEGRQTVRIVDVVTWLLETDREKIRDVLFAKGKTAAEEAKGKTAAEEARKAIAERAKAKADG